MLSRVKSAALSGLDAHLVLVEVDARRGLPQEIIVGLPDAVIRESKSRIRSALKHSGFDYPLKSYVINLAPAELKKEGPLFDLPIAVGILQSTNQIPLDTESLFVGELSLDGQLRPVRGVLSICDMVLQKKAKRLFIPIQNMMEAQLISEVEIVPIKSLSDITAYYNGTYSLPECPEKYIKETQHALDFADVKGHSFAKRALEISSN